ncbi:MAG TPA: hypothetical protein VHI13_10370 [Candidatus Kapabacteria bacterium]|nr:hypothetical protein [Candidatus Kapabacteria bacterium]
MSLNIVLRFSLAAMLPACCALASCVSLSTEDLRGWDTAMRRIDTAHGHVGRFGNADSAVSVKGFYLWDQIGGRESLPTDAVEIVALSNRLRFRLIRGGTAVDSMERAATMAPTYATLGGTRIAGIPPLLWGIFDEAIALGVSGTGELTLLRTAGGVGFLGPLPLMAGGGGPPYGLTFRPAGP